MTTSPDRVAPPSGSSRPMPWSASSSIAAEFDVGLFDLDGVVYVGRHAVPHAVESINASQARGMRPAYVTNNASRTPADVAEHLRSFGLSVSADDVVTSAQAGARALGELLAARGLDAGPVLAIGGPGVAAALRERGMSVTTSADDAPVGVLQGFGPSVGWPELQEASVAVGRGVTWVATNPDVSIPTPRGRAPGNGAFTQAVALATGRTPDLVAGKPHRPLIVESLQRTGAERAIMIGDRLDTDIEAGVAAELPTLLVMTGVTDVMDVLMAGDRQRPNFISLDLRGLAHEHPPVDRRGSQFSCGRATLSLDQAGNATWSWSEKDVSRDDRMWSEAMRCMCAAAWSWDVGTGEDRSRALCRRFSGLGEVMQAVVGGVRARIGQ